MKSKDLNDYYVDVARVQFQRPESLKKTEESSEPPQRCFARESQGWTWTKGSKFWRTSFAFVVDIRGMLSDLKRVLGISKTKLVAILIRDAWIKYCRGEQKPPFA